MKKRNHSRWFFMMLFLSVGWAVFIWSNSLQVGTASTAQSDSILDLIVRIVGIDFSETMARILTFWIRKSAHFIAFFILAVLLSGTVLLKRKPLLKHSLFVLFPVLSVAVLDEYIQSFVRGRSSEVQDILIDFFGGSCGFFVLCFIVAIIAHQKRKYHHEVKINESN